MKAISFAARNAKEILRDKLNLVFGIGFPVVLLLFLTLIQSNIPVPLFAIDQLAPGAAVFGLSFIALFSGLNIAKDRGSSLILRLLASPMKAGDYILGYTLPLVPMAAAQIVVCFAVSLCLGLEPGIRLLLAIVVMLPAALVYIALGLFCGTLFNDKQVGSICGALLTNLSAWLSGTWFDPGMVGGVFGTVADFLPFSHAVNAGRYALAGAYTRIMPELYWVLGYGIVLLLLAAWAFTRKMNRDGL